MINMSWSPLASFHQQRAKEIKVELTILFLLCKLEPKAGVPHCHTRGLGVEIGNFLGLSQKRKCGDSDRGLEANKTFCYH